jgi:hypothetical protein
VNITVVYGKIVDMDAARRCQRCYGAGTERHGARKGQTCPHCDGTGTRPEGWAYAVPPECDWLAIGDIVECPPTPYSNGVRVLATVVGLDAEPAPGRPLKEIICRYADAWPETREDAAS